MLERAVLSLAWCLCPLLRQCLALVGFTIVKLLAHMGVRNKVFKEPDKM